MLPPMRIAIVTDIHANRQAWEAVLADIRHVGADAILCLGDVVGYGPQPAAVLDSVRNAADAILLGNHEAAICGRFPAEEFNDAARRAIEWTASQLSAEDTRFFLDLPYTGKVEGFAISHSGLFEPEEFYYIEEPDDAESSFGIGDFALTFFGHTHIPANFRLDPATGRIEHLPATDFVLTPGRRHIVNAGSVGEIRTGATTACYCLLDLEAGAVRFRHVPFDIAAYRADLEASSLSRRPMFLLAYEGHTITESEKQPFALKRRRRENVAAIQRTAQGLRAAREAETVRRADREAQAEADRRAASLELLKQSADARRLEVERLRLRALDDERRRAKLQELRREAEKRAELAAQAGRERRKASQAKIKQAAETIRQAKAATAASKDKPSIRDQWMADKRRRESQASQDP